MSKEIEAIDIQENFINCFKELLTKTNHNIMQVNITKNMAQEIVNLYEQYKKSKPSEALDKLEECANGMKDLPKSNWIDLADNEAELDLKIMDWVETIKFELFKGKQALQKAQEQEKVLNVIKKKNVDVRILDISPTCEIYNEQVLNCQQLTKEEFNLLKRHFNVSSK